MIIFLGRDDHLKHPTVKKFLELAKSQNVDVKFCTNENFFDVDLSSIKVILIKAEVSYRSQEVWDAINEYSQIVVVNSYKSIQYCLDRIKINNIMNDLGIQTPRSAITKEEISQILETNPIFIKPKDANSHDLRTCKSLEEIGSLDFNNYLYQECIISDGIDYKYYGIGDKVFCISRKAAMAKHHEEKVKEERKPVETLPLIVEAIQKLRKEMDLGIFGIDFIKRKGNSNTLEDYYAIDLNLFPGHIGQPTAAQDWIDYAISLIN